MANAGEGIDVGDAVLHFLGDTTNLDVAFDRVKTGSEGIDVGDAVLHFLGDTTNLDVAFDRVKTGSEAVSQSSQVAFDALTGKIKEQENEIQQPKMDGRPAGSDIQNSI